MGKFFLLAFNRCSALCTQLAHF